MATSKKFQVAGIVVEAVRSEGGGFYTITLPNGETHRVLAEVFETVAKEYHDDEKKNSDGGTGNP